MGSITRAFKTNKGIGVKYVITDGDLSKYKEGGGVEQMLKFCILCGRKHPIIDFFVRSRMGRVPTKKGLSKRFYQIVEGGQGEDHAKCYRHFPDVVLNYPDKSKGEQLLLRFGDLRDDRGQPIDNWDYNAHKWVALLKIGTRLMPPDYTAIRFQPRQDRSKSCEGVPYNKNPAPTEPAPPESPATPESSEDEGWLEEMFADSV